MKELNEIMETLAPSDAALLKSMEQKLNIWSAFGELVAGEKGVNQLEYLSAQLLCLAVEYYQASQGYVLALHPDSSPWVCAQWGQYASMEQLGDSGKILASWEKRLGVNRAVFIPNKNAAAQFLGQYAPHNVLGILCRWDNEPGLLMLLYDMKAQEESYCFLETACHFLCVNSLSLSNAVQPHTGLLFSQEEDNQADTEKKLKYYQALLFGCDVLCDIDLEADTYQIITADENQVRHVARKGCYSQQADHIVKDLVHPDDKAYYRKYMSLENLQRVFSEGHIKKQQITYRRQNIDGQYRWKNDIVLYMEQKEGCHKNAILLSYNFDVQKQDETIRLDNYLRQQEIQYRREIHRKDEIYRIIGEQTKVGAFEWSRPLNREEGFSLTYISPELANEFQFYRQDMHLFTYLLNTNRVHHRDQEDFRAFLQDASPMPVQIVCRITPDGYTYYWYQFTKRTIINETEGEERMIGTVLNVDEETNASYDLKRKARLDSLTGLLNQEAFYAESQRLLKNNPDGDYAVIIMDIDNFKLVNSLYGMNVGNQVLAQIGQTLVSCLSKSDICARVYADVYYIVTEYHSDEEIIKLLDHMMERLTYVEHSSLILPCFGISNSKASERNITLLCELASFAHKYSKGNARERYTFYDVSIRQTIIEEKQMESEMEFALQNGQFKIYLQPKYIISNRQVVGAEALVRWEHPTKGMIVPAKFISLFEKNGFILKLDEYIWEQVCMLLHKWQTSGLKCIPISVNMSRLHLNNRDFKSTIVNLLQKYKVNHKWFELELTENLLFENLNQMISVLSDLQHQGFNINMDDFGSGYSSLNMLRNIPIDILKIDGNFFDEKMLTPKGKTIVKYVVSMAKELNMQVVAEGVENLSQEKFLLEVGCEIAQGFYFSRPLSVPAFESKYWHT